jgi:hypothetical protein
MYHTIQSRMKPINTFIRAYSTYSRRELYELIQINRRDFDSQIKCLTNDVASHASIMNDQLTRELARHHNIHVRDAKLNCLRGLSLVPIGSNDNKKMNADMDSIHDRIARLETKVNKLMNDK